MKDISQIDFTSPAKLWEIISRRRWYLFSAMVIALATGSYLAITLPKIYSARTVILVEPQRVPQNYVKSIVSDDINSRINTISQQILSRTNLEVIINQFNLFTRPEFDGMFIEDKINILKGQIRIRVQGNKRNSASTSFSIRVNNKDPKLAMFIANALAASFITENLKVRETQAVGTSEFLDAELSTMRVRLEEQEQRLADYRQAHMGEMPEQLDTNLKIIQVLQDELQKKESDLQDLQNQTYEIRELAAKGDEYPAPGVQPNINSLRRRLVDLEARYTAKHPDIIRTKQMIIELENRPPSADGDEVDVLEEIGEKMDATKGEIAEIRTQINRYKQRVEATPQRELDLIGLNRDYNNIKGTYQSLLKRRLEAEIAVNMERRQKGEQFRILDRAIEPNRPYEPDMQRLFMMVLASGLGVGCSLVLLAELMDNAFRSPDEVAGALDLPILAMVPAIASVRTRALAYAHSGATILSLMIIGLLAAGLWSLVYQGIGPTLAALGNLLPAGLLEAGRLG